jgi:hypothetical protein
MNSAAEPIGQIDPRHDAYLRTEMPRLLSALNRLAINEGEADPSLVKVRNAFARFMLDMLDYLDHTKCFPSVPGEEWLIRIRQLTCEFCPAPAASATQRQIVDELHRLDRSLLNDMFRTDGDHSVTH